MPLASQAATAAMARCCCCHNEGENAGQAENFSRGKTEHQTDDKADEDDASFPVG